jgi:Uma2 family endonuclease
MNALLKPMTLDEFVAWEERQELRYEYDGFVARAMTGGTLAHSTIQANLLRALGNTLRGGPCRAHGSELKVRTDSSVRYPDALVTCSRGDPRSTFAPDPVVLFEILSRSTARSDLGAKNVEYQTLPSLRRYAVLHQSVAAAEVFLRDYDGEWAHEFVGAEGRLAMPEIGVTLPLAEIYEGVEFAA